MAEMDSSSTYNLDIQSEVSKYLSQALGIVDLLGNLNHNESLDDYAINNASWAAKDLIKRAMDLIGKHTIVETHSNPVAQ